MCVCVCVCVCVCGHSDLSDAFRRWEDEGKGGEGARVFCFLTVLGFGGPTSPQSAFLRFCKQLF